MTDKKTNKKTDKTDNFAVSRVPTTLLVAVHMKGKDIPSNDIAKEISDFVNREDVVKILFDTSSKLTNIASENKLDILNVIVVPRVMMPANDDEAKIISNFADDFLSNSKANKKTDVAGEA